MSHQPERKEKNCLNCGRDVLGRYCQFCGQENIVPKQNFWSLLKHFIYDVLHFDGKFFNTLLYIFTKPGFVAREFVAGKRLSYLDPIRMYLFTSAIFFLVFFSVNDLKINDDNEPSILSPKARQTTLVKITEQLKNNPNDTLLRKRQAMLQDTTRPIDIHSEEWGRSDRIITFAKIQYHSVAQYDSVQATLPPEEKHNWLTRKFVIQSIKINNKYGQNRDGVNGLVDSFVHKLPYMLFFSLPFFALVLKLLYIRRKTFYYSDHAVFTLYHYIFSFILLLIILGINGLQNWSGWGVFDFLVTVLYIAWPVYLYIEMKNFYRQGWGKTFVKFLFTTLLGIVGLTVLFIFFLLFSFFQV